MNVNLVHVASPHCNGAHCYTCNVDHQPGRADFKRCGHCGHIYRTPRQLQTRFREQAIRLDMDSVLLRFKDPNQISNCMECLKPFGQA